MAMLVSLCAFWSREKLFCLHVNHSLRPAESAADAEFVAAFCKEQGVQCNVVDIPPGKIARFAKRKGTGIEAAARFFRRRAFFKEAARLGENVLILTAHTKDDLLETALMRVLRGSGPAGLASMPVKKGRLLRPLLSVTRADVVDYLKAKNIPWREDSTNADEKLLRNRIRRRLIPLLDEAFPSWKAALCGLAETQSLAASFLAEEAQRRVIWETARSSGKTHLSLSTDAESFFAHPMIIREEAIFQGLDRLLAGREGSALVKRAVVRRFCAGNAAAADFGPLRVRRKGGKLVLALKRKECHESGFSLLIKEPGLYNLKNISIEVCLPARDEEGGFTAALPLVFRRTFKDDFFIVKGRKIRGNLKDSQVCALDVFGTAAFIGPRGLEAARDNLSGGQELFSVKISSNKTGGCND
jgi:tRNA(Ile)-lysidine synthase